MQCQYKQLERETARDRERLCGWFVLIYLVMLLELKLEKLQSFLDKTHPPEASYSGKGWLVRTTNEYRLRFAIDLKNYVRFPLIREIVIARNAIVHNGGKPTSDYLELPNRRFLGKMTRMEFLGLNDQDVIDFSNKDFKEVSVVLDEFVDWLVRELHFARDGSRPVGPLRGAQLVR